MRLAEIIRMGLHNAGIDADVEHDGAVGLWRAQEGSYDAVVLDIMLPKLNGYEVCRSLREGGDETPVLMLTAKDGEFDEAEALDTGADDYLRKPFSLVVARRGASARPAAVTCGPITFDSSAGVVERSGDRISLSRAVPELLVHGRRGPGRNDRLDSRLWM